MPMFFPLYVLHRQYSIAKHFKNWVLTVCQPWWVYREHPSVPKYHVKICLSPSSSVTSACIPTAVYFMWPQNWEEKKNIFAKLFCDPEHIILIDHSLTMEQLSSIFLCKAPPLTQNSVHLCFFQPLHKPTPVCVVRSVFRLKSTGVFFFCAIEWKIAKLTFQWLT